MKERKEAAASARKLVASVLEAEQNIPIASLEVMGDLAGSYSTSVAATEAVVATEASVAAERLQQSPPSSLGMIQKDDIEAYSPSRMPTFQSRGGEALEAISIAASVVASTISRGVSKAISKVVISPPVQITPLSEPGQDQVVRSRSNRSLMGGVPISPKSEEVRAAAAVAHEHISNT
jgi:hypothetical protein